MSKSLKFGLGNCIGLCIKEKLFPILVLFVYNVIMKVKPEQIIPLYEYPRPQFERSSYLCLNGIWRYAFSNSDSRLQEMDGNIVVPYSPESRLSGVNRQLQKDQFLHYCRYFKLPDGFFKGRLILNIGAIDQRCRIYINGHFVAQWNFGYIPISVDITKYIVQYDNNEIYIVVYDDADSEVFARGKQAYKRGGIWYTAISGIYQTVFLESVPKNYLRNIKITPEFDNQIIKFDLDCVGELRNINFDIYEENKLIQTIVSKNGESISFRFHSIHPWTCEDPFLYDVKIRYSNDEIFTYFAMRKFSVLNVDKFKYFALNNKPILMKGVLDQGYFYDGIYTPKFYKDYLKDIKLAKALGFNVLRKHIKIEPYRFYYYCDKLGMIVWQDFVNGGAKYKKSYIYLRPFFNFNVDDLDYKKLGRANEKSRIQFYKEMNLTVATLYNCPCIGLWTIFNEGWGQFDSEQATEVLKTLDQTRLIDSASGWYDQGAGDCNSKHVYFKTIRIYNDYKRVLSLSEFGGYSLYIKDHSFSKKSFGYKKMYNSDELSDEIYKLFVSEVKHAICHQGLSAYIYTQLSDVEDEVNGFITYDRKVIKVDIDKIKSANEALDKIFYVKFNHSST